LFSAADLLEREAGRDGSLQFDRGRIRIEANDRLRAPNSDDGFVTFKPIVEAAAQRLSETSVIVVERAVNDPRDRLAVEVLLRCAGED